MINNEEYKNSEEIYKEDMVESNSETSDGYDYLDSLMGDLLSTEKSESAEITKDNFRDGEENLVRPDDKENNIEIRVEEYKEEIVEKVPKKRVSLFKKMGLESGSTREENYELKEKESEAVIETEETIEISKETIEQREEISVESVEENKDLESAREDFFENMLNELVTDEVIESEISLGGREQESQEGEVVLDTEVIIPLETPEMSEVRVTADGRTLAEMLPGLRGGNKTVNQIVREIKNQEKVVKVGDKKFSDNRYTEHVEVIDKKREEQDKRRELSMKFLQRNAKFTEQEKIIMENLGVSNKQFTNLMKSKELTKAEKAKILGLGKYGAEKHFKGRKYRTTVGDTAMLEFLVKFKFANTRILRWISNEPQGRTWRKLDRLRNNGLVESQTLIGIPDLWAATYAGVAVSGYSYEPGLRPIPKMITISSSMGVNYIAACLWFNTVNVLNLSDFPAHNREIALQNDGRDRVQGEMLVSELEIRSSLGKEINPHSTTMKSLGDEKLYDVISSNVRKEFDKWKASGKEGESPEFALGNEYMWVLFPTSQLTLSYHVPDLVVKRERGPNGEPRSIAVEMERYEKSNDKYDKIMLAYKLDENLYESVVWITPNNRVAKALERAAEAVGFTKYSIVPIITETGVYKKPDIWMI